jgi:glycosyltransferase involved in cell wall biosynthesis
MISVVTITYNNFEQLRSTVESLVNEKCKFELIIVNGGTCKATLDYLNNLKLDSVAIKIVSEPDEGISDAFNKGISLATGDAIIFLNSGDFLISHNYLRAASSLFEKDKSIDYIHSNILFEDESCGKMLMVPRMCDLGRGMPYHHQTLIVRKKVFEKIGGFNKAYKVNMDYDFVCRMKKEGFKGHYWRGKEGLDPVVLMDGTGVAISRESFALREAFDVLKKNDLLSFNVFYNYCIRLVFFYLRKIVTIFGLSNLLKKLKRKKNKNLAEKILKS